MKNNSDFYIDMFNEALDELKDSIPADRFYEIVPSTLIEVDPEIRPIQFVEDINQGYKLTAMKRCLQGLGIDEDDA